MTETADVMTFPKNGQWAVHVPDAPELSRSFSSRDEAVAAGEKLARERRAAHVVGEEPATGAITDRGDVDDPVAITGTKPPRHDGLPETTDESGLPLDNPSG